MPLLSLVGMNASALSRTAMADPTTRGRCDLGKKINHFNTTFRLIYYGHLGAFVG